MDMKEKLAKMITDRLSDDQKREMIQALYDKHKDRADIDDLVKGMKKQLGYKKNDVPKRD